MTGMAQNHSDKATGLSLPERHLARTLADWLVTHLLPVLQRGPNGKYDSAGGSALETGCVALAALGLLHRGERGGIWIAAADPDQQLRQMNSDAALPRAVLAPLIQAYISFAAGHLARLPATRSGFAAPDGHEAPCAALLRAGYLRREGNWQLFWTERAAPFMQEALLWDGDGQTLHELRRSKGEAEARAFLNSLPVRLRDALRVTVLEEGGLAGIDLLKRHWTGEDWSEIPRLQGVSLGNTGFRVSVFATLVRLVQEGRA